MCVCFWALIWTKSIQISNQLPLSYFILSAAHEPTWYSVYDRFVCICLLTVAIQVLFYLKSCVVLLISLSTVHVEYCIFWRSQSPSLLLIIFQLMLHFVGSTSCSIFVIICYIPKNSQEIFCTSKWWSSWFIISGIDYFSNSNFSNSTAKRIKCYLRRLLRWIRITHS